MLPERAWFAEPMLWLVLGIPLATVIAGVFTIAMTSGGIGIHTVGDNVKRTAQVQVADLSIDQNAANLQMRSVLTVDRKNHTVVVEIESMTGNDASITAAPILRFEHPAQDQYDIDVVLKENMYSFIGQADLSSAAHWRVILSSTDNRWRLIGRLEKSADRIVLEPAVDRSTKHTVQATTLP